MLDHYCSEHQNKFYKNEKVDRFGKLNIWYSHKIINGQGFCVEKETNNSETGIVQTKSFIPTLQSNSNPMLSCNAMNNAIALAANDKIKVDQIGAYYQKILSELTSTAGL